LERGTVTIGLALETGPALSVFKNQNQIWFFKLEIKFANSKSNLSLPIGKWLPNTEGLPWALPAYRA
jgi:hypothetical protein